MGSFSIWHWLIVGVVVLLVFGGKGKISEIMGDFAKGIKSFKKGLSEDDEKAATPAEPPKTIEQAPVAPATAATSAATAAPVATADKATEARKVG